MTKPVVSVVMNCFNCERYLRAAIDSVYAQTFNNWEIVFFDNASTDQSGVIASEYDYRLRYIRSKGGLTLGEARNEALAYCEGEFIAFLDCDDYWLPKKLEKQLPMFKDPHVGLVFSNNTLFTEDGKWRLNYRGSKDYRVGDCFEFLLGRYFLSIPTVMIRRDVLARLHQWFDPEFSVCEEVDLFLRIAYGSKILMSPDVLAANRLHSGSETWKKSELFLIETTRIIEKYRALYPNFDERFSRGIREMKDRALWTHAIFCWRKGKVAKARVTVLSMQRKGFKQLIFLLLATIPYRWLRLMIAPLGKTLPR